MLRSFLYLTLCSLAICSAARPAAWTIETVDSSGAAGHYASLAVDGGGRLHLCYYDSAGGDLRYALRTGGAWTYEDLDTAGNVGLYCAVVVGADNNPRISYFDSTNRALKFASYNGTQWIVETADPGPGVGQYTSVCLNGTTPIVSYYDQSHGDLKLATRSGTWILTRIDSAGNVGRFSSVANSGTNQTKISYYSDTLRQLKYVRQQGSNWVVELPDPAINAGLFTSLALTGNVPTIAYFDSAGGRIQRATKPSTSWVVDTADNSGNAGGYVSLAYDPAGLPAVSYFEAANGDLRLARHSGTAWTTEAVDTAGTVGLYTSCRIGSDSTIYIAYYDRSLGRLKLAVSADTVPPGPPQNLTANGASPSPWSNNPKFGLVWTNPYDRSGIGRSLYKLGEAPTSNYDTSGSLSAAPPDSATATALAGQMLHLWLVDGAGNTDFQNRASVLLRYDSLPPSGCAASSSPFSATPSFVVSWNAGSDSGGSGLTGRYAVRVRDGAGLWNLWLADTQALSAVYPGIDGHRYYFEAAAWDSAGNCEAFSTVAECSTLVNTSLPAVISMSLAPDTVLQAGLTVLSARITDNQRVTAAEFFIDVTGDPGAGIAASPVDSFGQASVDVRDTIFAAALSIGAHWVFLHGRDDAGQWGPFDSVSFYKPAPDTAPPSFVIQISPTSPSIGVAVSVSAAPSEPLHPDSTAACTLRAADGSLLPLALAMDSVSLKASLSTSGLPAGACRLTVSGYDRWSNRGSSSIEFILSASGEFLPEDMVYIWPNPVRGGLANFHYYVNSNASVTAEVFTLDGRRVAKLTGRGQGGRPPHRTDSNMIVFDASGLASDVYLLRLTATSESGGEQRTVMKKFAIIR